MITDHPESQNLKVIKSSEFSRCLARISDRKLSKILRDMRAALEHFLCPICGEGVGYMQFHEDRLNRICTSCGSIYAGVFETRVNAVLWRELRTVLEGQAALAAQTVRIRRILLGIDENVEDPAEGVDTEELARRAMKKDMGFRINVKTEIPMAPYAGGVYFSDVVRVEREDDGSITAVTRPLEVAVMPLRPWDGLLSYMIGPSETKLHRYHSMRTTLEQAGEKHGQHP